MQMNMLDGFMNLVSGLNVAGRDKSIHGTHVLSLLTTPQLATLYRESWVSRKIVDCVAEDLTREWRTWKGKEDETSAMYAVENAMGLQGKLQDVIAWERLLGGGAIYIGINNQNAAAPLEINNLSRGSLRYIHVFDKDELSYNELDTDIASPNFGKPKMYQIMGDKEFTDIHPSRLVRMNGQRIPNAMAQTNSGWGDSVLQSMFSAIRNSEGTAANIASLVYEAKVDIIKMPELNMLLSTSQGEAELLRRFAAASMIKGNIGTLLLGEDETYDRKETTFAGLTDVLAAFWQEISGAASIPVTRLFGRAPAGMNATGESDMRNYYDMLRSKQTGPLTSALRPLDEVIKRHVFGKPMPDVWYDWTPLYTLNEKERAEVNKYEAETAKIHAESGTVPLEVMAQGVKGKLIEIGLFPNIEQAYDKHGNELTGTDEADDLKEIADAAPRSLYVSRKVLNAAEIVRWGKSQGVEFTVPADELHVTIMYSRTPLDWMAISSDSWGDPSGEMIIPAGGPRLVERFDGGAVVLIFNASQLRWRHMEMREAGAESDYEEYQPHITFTYTTAQQDISKIEPYTGKIVLGPEIFAEIKD